LLRDRGQFATLTIRPLGEPIPPSQGESPFPLDFYLSWMSTKLRLFAAQLPRPPMPLSTPQDTPHDVPCKTRGQDGFATSFPVGLLHPLQHAGLSRRSPVCPSSDRNWCQRCPRSPESAGWKIGQRLIGFRSMCAPTLLFYARAVRARQINDNIITLH
jgi:hypothetical protein